MPIHETCSGLEYLAKNNHTQALFTNIFIVPMTYTSDERQVRIQKRQELKDMGIVPYVQKRHKESNIAELIEKANAGNLRSIEEILQAPQKNSVTAGRLILKRISGKLSFAQIIDETAQIQLMFEHQ